MRSIVSLLAMAPDRASAAQWASELEKNGFAHHSAEDIKKALSVRPLPPLLSICSNKPQDPSQPIPGLAEGESFGTPTSEHFAGPAPNVGESSYDGSSRGERQVESSTTRGQIADERSSREQSQSGLSYPSENSVDGITPLIPSPLGLHTPANDLHKFAFDCAYYRRTKRELLANGWDATQIFGRSEIDVDTLLLGFLDPQDTHPVSTWCSRTINKLLPATPLSVRLASTYLLTKMLRVS